jgi:hypothetical protein
MLPRLIFAYSCPDSATAYDLRDYCYQLAPSPLPQDLVRLCIGLGSKAMIAARGIQWGAIQLTLIFYLRYSCSLKLPPSEFEWK